MNERGRQYRFLQQNLSKPLLTMEPARASGTGDSLAVPAGSTLRKRFPERDRFLPGIPWYQRDIFLKKRGTNSDILPDFPTEDLGCKLPHSRPHSCRDMGYSTSKRLQARFGNEGITHVIPESRRCRRHLRGKPANSLTGPDVKIH